MKIQLKSMLFLLPLSFIFLMSCKKHEGDEVVTINNTDLAVVKPGILSGTFTMTGVITVSGTSLMQSHASGDSSHCTATMTAKEGTFTMHYDCSNTNMTGSWHVIDGTGKYTNLRGSGTLVMMRPPNVPSGIVGMETLTGVMW
jgi:hypothetical protein